MRPEPANAAESDFCSPNQKLSQEAQTTLRLVRLFLSYRATIAALASGRCFRHSAWYAAPCLRYQRVYRANQTFCDGHHTAEAIGADNRIVAAKLDTVAPAIGWRLLSPKELK